MDSYKFQSTIEVDDKSSASLVKREADSTLSLLRMKEAFSHQSEFLLSCACATEADSVWIRLP